MRDCLYRYNPFFYGNSRRRITGWFMADLSRPAFHPIYFLKRRAAGRRARRHMHEILYVSEVLFLILNI